MTAPAKVRRMRAIRALALLLAVLSVVVYSSARILGAVRWNSWEPNSGIWTPDEDFCNYVREDHGAAQEYPYNEYQRPIIDMENNLYICVTPKCGITKMQSEFRAYRKRQTGAEPTYNYVNEVVHTFTEKYGPLRQSVPASNFTKIFVYRNPVDRLISLFLDKFDPKRIKEAWVSRILVKDYHIPDFDLLLRHLEHYTLKSLKDPHIWPQTAYCQLDTIKYDYSVDIDDHETLSEVFGQFWGKDEVNFGTLTKHATKSKTDEKTSLREKLHLWRSHFVRAFGGDIQFYCGRQSKSKVASSRTK